jgi:hypothetical protein
MRHFFNRLCHPAFAKPAVFALIALAGNGPAAGARHLCRFEVDSADDSRNSGDRPHWHVEAA